MNWRLSKVNARSLNNTQAVWKPSVRWEKKPSRRREPASQPAKQTRVTSARTWLRCDPLTQFSLSLVRPYSLETQKSAEQCWTKSAGAQGEFGQLFKASYPSKRQTFQAFGGCRFKTKCCLALIIEQRKLWWNNFEIQQSTTANSSNSNNLEKISEFGRDN